MITVTVPCKEGEMVDVENAFNIYPNPNDGTFNIEANVTTQNFASQELTTIEIYNNFGQVIYSKQVNSELGIIRESISIDDQPSGIYVVAISNENFIQLNKFVKD